MSMKLEWERTPLALRVGLIATVLSQVVRFALVMTRHGDDEELWRNPILMAIMGLFDAVWVASDVLCLVGAVQLARRSPRAKLLVWSYALGLGMYLVWQLFDAVQWSGDPSSYRSALTVLRYVAFAATAFTIVAWAMVGRNPLLVIAIALLLLVGNLPPFADGVYMAVGLSSYRGHIGMNALVHLLATAAMLFVVMGLPFERPAEVRLPPQGGYTLAAWMAGLAMLSELVMAYGSPLAHTGAVLCVVVGGALGYAWLAVALARARTTGTAGAWAMNLAALMCAVAAVVHADLLNLAASMLRGQESHIDLAGGGLWMPLPGCVGLVAALAGVAQAASERGAVRARRIASGYALAVVAATVVYVVTCWDDPTAPTLAILVGYGAGAIGLAMAGNALGDGAEMPTATLRS
jgi:hypothetical protein